MKTTMNILLSLACAMMLFALLSSPSKEDLEIAWEEGYEDGRVEGYDEGYKEGKTDGIFNGLQSNLTDSEEFFVGMLYDAKTYAEERSDDMSFWEAMDVVSVYIDGYDPDGYPLPSEKKFEKAVEVILDYAVCLEWNALQIEESYE